MEAAALGRRVIVAAHSSFSEAPFVVRPTSREAYAAELRSRVIEPPRSDTVELARRFMSRLYFDLMIDMPYVREDPTGFHVGNESGGDMVLRRKVESIISSARTWRPHR